ncbi:response regulator transcription factor [Antribacter soli]|uniref:response regulator transcription factor n=1 Tax=Antribacter soli TaxID=2910976 RepID=UPI0027E1764A|nr:response regulator transcription factor [Antribacter soli]
MSETRGETVQDGEQPASGNRVLVVDDDSGLARALSINLRAHGWDVIVAPTGAAALDAAASGRPDVVLLDLGLPDMSGLDVIAGIRGWTRVPIVVLSARQLGDDKVDALDAGADDYVTKPFAMNELLARLRAAVRRARPVDADEPVIEAGELRIDLARRVVSRAGEDVRLSPTEWALLEVLVRNRGRMVGRQQLLREVWGPAYSTETNYLRVYTAQLRRKLEADPAHPRHLLTHPGAGYRFEE